MAQSPQQHPVPPLMLLQLRARHAAGRWDGAPPGFLACNPSKIKRDVMKQKGMHQRRHLAKQTVALRQIGFHILAAASDKVAPQPASPRSKMASERHDNAIWSPHDKQASRSCGYVT